MSAVRKPDPSSPEQRQATGRAEAQAPQVHGLAGHKGTHGAESPVRKLQAELAARLTRRGPIMVYATLATLLVLCLSMSVAALLLLTSA